MYEIVVELWYLTFFHVCCRDDEKQVRNQGNDSGSSTSNYDNNPSRRNLMHLLGLTVPRTSSASTQTVHRVRRTASTQTDGLAFEENNVNMNNAG